MNNLLNKQKIISIDFETNGLWGQPFSAAAVVYDENNNETNRYVARCPIEGEVNGWVKNNVIPQMEGIKQTHDSYDEMLKDFFDILKEHKDAKVLVHMGHVVEANVLRDAHSKGIIGDWDAPYEWYDVCVLFGDSVDKYNKTNGVSLEKDLEGLSGGTHNPLYDCIATARAFQDYQDKAIEKEMFYENVKDVINSERLKQQHGQGKVWEGKVEIEV